MTSGGNGPGDTEYGLAKGVTCVYKDSNSEVDPVEPGMAVAINGENSGYLQVTVADTDHGTGVDGVVMNNETIADGGYVNVCFEGDVWARVESSSEGSAGGSLGAGSTAGELDAANSEFDQWHSTESRGGENVALVKVDSN